MFNVNDTAEDWAHYDRALSTFNALRTLWTGQATASDAASTDRPGA